jgi:hypothetical protein
VGALSAAAAVGGIGARCFSGRLGHVRRQGLAILVAVVGWGFAIAGFGAAMLAAGGVLSRGTALWLGLVAMAVAGGSDSVSAVFRTTILQSATPDHLRGRLQGVFIVVVAGGPRLGDLRAGALATATSVTVAMVSGGVVIVVAMIVVALAVPSFFLFRASSPAAGRP